MVLNNVSFTLPVPLAATLLIPATAARVQLNAVPGVILAAIYLTAVPLVAFADKEPDNTGFTFGAATALASALVQPLTVCLTV